MGSEARTRVGLWVLLLVTLFSFGQVFDRGDWPGPALMGMALAVLVVAGARRLGWSTAWTIVASTGVLIWYLALVFRMQDLFYGLPTLDALRGIWGAIDTAQAKSNLDYAPVPLRTGYVVLTVIATWFAAVIGEVATFRWRRPLVAVVPLISLFSFLTIVGTRTGTTLLVLVFLSALLSYLALEASHRLRAWGSWVTSLADRRRETPSEVSSRLARRMGASCIAAALFAPVFLPALGDGLLAWRSPAGEGAGPGAGGATGGEIDLLASLQPRLIEQSQAEMFEVVADRAEYWRLTSLVTFDGTTWRRLQGQPNVPVTQGQVTARYPVGSPTLVQQQYTILGLEGELLPAAVQPVTAGITHEVESRDNSDLRYEFEVGDVQLRGEVIEDLVYEVTSNVAEPTFKQMQAARPAQADAMYHEPGPIPISPEVDALAREWTQEAKTPFAQLIALQDNLRARFAYRLDVPPAASTDHLSDFLLRTRRGYCQQFAAAFALLARHLGFASRVSVGFLPGETSIAEPDRFLVRGTDAHSWPEVLFEGYGWIRFEPTPGNGASPPRYTSRAVPFSAQNPFSDAEGNGGGRNPARLEGNQEVPLGGRDRGGEVSLEERREQASARWQETFSNMLSFVLLSLLALIAAVPVLKTGRTWLRYRAAREPGALTHAAFAQFEDEARELASPRRISESALAYARRMGAGYKVPGPQAIELATIYERSLYARAAIDEAQAAHARRLAKALRGHLWATAGSWSKLKRLFSPGSLFAR